jgi:hypothetical protein
MSRVPVITSPCPLRWSSMPKPGQDFCGQCQRQVHNLDLMSAGQRNHFMQSCKGEVCISYTIRRPISLRNAALSLSLAAGMASGSAVAQDAADTKVIESKLVQSVESWKAAEKEESKELDFVMVLGGTVLDPGTSRWVDESEIETDDLQELPQTTDLTWLKTPEK